MGFPATLSVACCSYDRTRPLLDGRVRIANYSLRAFPLPLDEILCRAYHDAEFDVVELGLGSYVRHMAYGDCPYLAVPAFPLRAFRHRSIYVRRERIYEPRDLAGKRVGVVDYGMTAAVVVRGMLRRLYGVDVGSIRWVVGGRGARGQQQGEPLTGVNIDVVGQGVALSEMLAQGAIDALIALSPPPCFVDGHPQIARLFADTRAAEIECFRTSARFPIMHLIAIRRTLADDSALASGVLSAFTAAKDYALSELGVTQASKVTLPWVAAAAQETKAVLGDDYWPYGVARNRAALSEFLNDAHQDGLTVRRLTVEDLFHPELLTT